MPWGSIATSMSFELDHRIGVPAETQVIDAIDSNPDGSINYWRDEAQVHHVPKHQLADVLV